MLPEIVRQDGIRKTTQVRFGGYDRRPEAWDGTAGNTLRLSPDGAPLVGSRRPYSYQNNYTSYVFGTDRLMEIRGGDAVYYEGIWVCTLSPHNIERKAVRFGRDWIIYPDKVLLRIGSGIQGHAASAEELEELEDPHEGDVWAVGGYLEYNPYLYTYTEGSWVQGERVMQNLEHSVTISGDRSAVFENGTYAGEAAEMNTLTNNHGDADWSGFKVGDAVEISGCTLQPLNNQTLVIREIDGPFLRFYENSFHGESVQAVTLDRALPMNVEYGGDTYLAWYYAQGITGEKKHFVLPFDTEEGNILVYSPYRDQMILFWGADHQFQRVISLDDEQPPGTSIDVGRVDIEFTAQEDHWSFSLIEESAVTVAKKLPDMDFIFGDSNRLWGCKGSMIYASALGDPSVFWRYDGLSDDSWSVEVFSPGAFTGAISHDGYPTFFKEKMRYKVFGAQPSAYQISETSCDGVKEGCSESLAIVGQTLLYLSPQGVMADSGAVPTCISRQLKSKDFSNARAGAWEHRYVICMQDATQVWRVFIFDLDKGIWLLDENRQFRNFANVGGVLYGVTDGVPSGGRLIRYAEDGEMRDDWDSEGTVESLLETNEYFMDNPNRKRIHRVQLRLLVGENSSLTVKVKYDSESGWRTVKTLGEGKLQSYYLPVRLRRCDHFRLRFEGVGDWTMFSMTLETVGGSAIH